MTKKKTTKKNKKTPTAPAQRLCVVAYGDPFDGTTLHGPFKNYEDAVRWADDDSCTDCWWIVDINDPN